MQPKLLPGFRFSNGKLMILTQEEVKLVNTWPDLEAVRKPARGGRWNAFVPCFRLLRPRGKRTERDGGDDLGPAEVRSGALDPLWEKELAFLNFRRSIPDEFAAVVEGFSNRQWGLLRLCEKRRQIKDLLLQNPALGFALANVQHFRVLSDDCLRLAAEISSEKQRDIIWRLGFPRSQAWANILAKIPADVVSLKRLLSLRTCCRDANLEKSLCHITSINAGVADLIEDQSVSRLASSTLLEDVANSAEERHQAQVVHLLRDLFQLHTMMGTLHQLRPLRSIAEVRRKHQEAVAAQAKRLERLKDRARLPDPPLPGTEHIIPLSRIEQLLEEGEQQHNCVGAAGPQMREGRCYIYRVLSPERATLSMEKGPDGCWQIQQLYLACNKPVKGETRRVVEDWLRQFSLSV